MNAVETLVAGGMPRSMAERIVKQAQTEAKPKEKKTRKYFPGMSAAKKKETLEVEVLVICECCGAHETQKKMLEILPDSPRTMKTAVQLCNQCPDFFRALEKEELVSLALVRHHAGLMHQLSNDRSQVRFAKKHTPEEVINFKVKQH